MQLSEAPLAFEYITEDDIPELTRVMTRAFDDHAQKHLGLERGGPPGYDTGDFFRQWLFGYAETVGYKVLRAGQVIGGVIVWILPDGHNVVGTIFVDPKAQNQGMGTRIWQFIEARSGATKSWRLTTPRWATKNHHFYVAKCHFARLESDPIVGSPEGEFVYRKDIVTLAAEGTRTSAAPKGGALRMQSETQSTPNQRPPSAPSYFDLQATWGVTKHFGGTQSTDTLAALCHIDRGAYVLDVGCGTGMTACYLAQTIGCRVVGVDISEDMIAWSRRRARRARLDERVTLSIADAQNLPFADRTFDAVICESVTAFVADKLRAVGEYARVVRPGGYVGLNEGAWLTPPPADLAGYLARVMGGSDFLAPDGWSALLARAGLTDLVVQCSTISARRQWKSELRRMDRDDLQEYLNAWKTFGSLLFTSASFRRYLRELWPPRSVLHLFDYLGYGVFVGRKSATGTQARKTWGEMSRGNL